MIEAIVFFPLIGALVAGLFGRRLGARPSEIITSLLLVTAALLAWIVFFQFGFAGSQNEAGAALAQGAQGEAAIFANTVKVELFRWIQVGDLDMRWVLRVDTLTAVMLVVVTTISAVVHVYSIGYMHDDPSRQRFFSYLSLFTFAMLMLVTADNFLQLFFGWEGVGLASYLLIGFWYQKPAANAAAIKAFIVNRVGDFGFALGIFGAFWALGSIDFDTAFAAVGTVKGTSITFLWRDWDALTVVSLLLFMGAMGKSAQFLLHTWLPDAMEGPTPVSALIHAATMVTAGVFMVARLSPIFEASPFAMSVVLIVGAITAFFAATIALVQNDIKRVVAYSTMSQLGYMFVALGAGAYSAGIFHLFTHAFFKALLFLGAGAVIQAVHHEQDMRKMGGLARTIPKTYIVMIIGVLALTGVGIPGTSFGFAGFFSKDAIIEAAYGVGGNLGSFAFWSLVISALFTSFYSWRLIYLTFHQKPRASREVMAHAKDSHNVMMVPLYVLAVGAVFSGVVFYQWFFGDIELIDKFFAGSLVVNHDILEKAHSVPEWAKWSASIAMLIGFVVAWFMYIAQPRFPGWLAARNGPLYRFLLNKWYFDELYEIIFIRPAMRVGRFLWRTVDDELIDKTIVEGTGVRVKKITARVVKWQTGYLYHYAFAMLIGVAALLTWTIVAGGLL